MVELFKASEAAIIALHSMALLSSDVTKTRNVKELARIINASPNHLSKVLLKLSKAGLIRSVRGPNGGFVLNMNVDEITVKDIYAAIEGRITVSKCFFKIHPCDGIACNIGLLSKRINEQYEKILTETKLSDIKLDISLFTKK